MKHGYHQETGRICSRGSTGLLLVFIDGTVHSTCRPRQNQRVIYNGHHRVHAIKFQSTVAPITNLYGPVEGRSRDSAMLSQSGLLTQLQQHCHAPNDKRSVYIRGPCTSTT